MVWQFTPFVTVITSWSILLYYILTYHTKVGLFSDVENFPLSSCRSLDSNLNGTHRLANWSHLRCPLHHPRIPPKRWDQAQFSMQAIQFTSRVHQMMLSWEILFSLMRVYFDHSHPARISSVGWSDPSEVLEVYVGRKSTLYLPTTLYYIFSLYTLVLTTGINNSHVIIGPCSEH